MEPTQPNETNKSNQSRVIIFVLLAIVIAQSIKIFLDYKEKTEVKQQLATTEKNLDGTMQQLKDVKVELEQKIVDLKKLGGNIADLEAAKAEVERELKRTTQRSAKAMKELKDRVDGYKELLLQKDEELEKLKSLNKELYSENKSLKNTQNKLSDSISALERNKNELAGKVAIASQLRAESIGIKAVNSKGKENDSPFRNRQLAKLKVEFSLADNKVAPIEGKKIIVRIVDENNQVIFDVAKGSGTFMLNGKEEFYTAAKEILFDNTKQKLIFYYEKGSEYADGTYQVEIFCDGYSIGKDSFTVK